MSGTLYKRRPQGSLKAAAAHLIAAAGGVNTPCGVSKTVLQRYGDPNSERQMPVHIVERLETLARDLPVTRYLAFAQNHLVVDLAPLAQQPYPFALAGITARTGDLLAAGGLAMADGHVDAGEARALKAHALKLAAAAAALIADCDAVIAAQAQS